MTYVGTLKNRGEQRGHQVSQATEFCTLATNICLFAVLNLNNVIVLSPTVLKCLLQFWKISGPLLNIEAASSFQTS
jgi:hypothetical protein